MPSPSELAGDADVAARCVRGGIRRRRFLHLQSLRTGARRRDAGRRLLARIRRGARHGDGHRGRRYSRRRVRHAG